jgi:general nucleoside transport system permease protein
MNKLNSRWLNIGFQFLAVLLALLFTTVILLLAGAPPFSAYAQIIIGSFGSIGKITAGYGISV